MTTPQPPVDTLRELLECYDQRLPLRERPHLWESVRAALAAIPEGYVLVRSPVTEDMHVAACKVLLRANGLDKLPQRMLNAMLAASPTPPTAPAQDAQGAWKRVREEVGTKGWTVGESCDYFGFFMHGWRAALRASTPAERVPLSLDAIRAWATRRMSALGPEGVTDPVAFLEEGVRWGEAQHGIVTKEIT